METFMVKIFSRFLQILVLCAISSHPGFEEAPDHLPCNSQPLDMPEKNYMIVANRLKSIPQNKKKIYDFHLNMSLKS